ncbi:MAG: hypothetical protein LBJ45_02370 [Holosporaceae bacterium]|nr:hypothetical protein [Holosporaceae bacterium]
MKAKVLVLEKKLFEGEVSRIVLSATDGEMCLLPHHAPLVTSLQKGQLKVFRLEGARPLIIKLIGGICSFRENNAVFLLEQENSSTYV